MQSPLEYNRTTWLNVSTSFSNFQQAKEHARKEQYLESRAILENSFHKRVELVSESRVMGDELVSLYAQNLYFLKDFDSLKKLFNSLEDEDFKVLPRVNIVRLNLMIQEGKSDFVFQYCSKYCEDNKDPISSWVADFLSVKGFSAFFLGKKEIAKKDLEISCSLFLYADRNYSYAFSANRLGIVFLQTEEFQDATTWLERAQKAFSTMGMTRKKADTLLNLGITHYKTGNLPAALETLTASHKIGEEGNWPHRMVFTNIALANVLRMQRQYDPARQRLHTAYNQAQALGYPREEALALEFLGDVYRDEAQPAQARRFYARAMAIGKSIAPEGDIVMEIHRRNGECLLLEQDLGGSVAELKQCLVLARAQGDRFEEAVALRVMAEVKQVVGDLDAAEEFMSESVEILTAIGARFELALSLMSWVDLKLSRLHQGRGDFPGPLLLTQAWNHATNALDHFLFSGATALIEECRLKVQEISTLRVAQERAERQVGGAAKGRPPGYVPSQVIVHTSTVMKDILRLTDVFAKTEEPVLVLGETGTGKELIARRLHQFSGRAERKMVSVNVTAIPATMFEREMFGHVRGAFSGADRDGRGFVAEAEGGTLFLDEIGELPLATQPKLLRLLQEGTYQVLGDPRERVADIRVVAATNTDLEQKVLRGEFRADLYYRLRVLELHLPPLRERDGDILFLLRHFLSELADRPVDLQSYFSQGSLDFIENHNWPGNVRELGLLARRAHVELVTRGQVSISLQRAGQQPWVLEGPQQSGEMKVMEAAGNQLMDRSKLVRVLGECGGSRKRAAEVLGVSRSTVYRWMKRMGLD